MTLRVFTLAALFTATALAAPPGATPESPPKPPKSLAPHVPASWKAGTAVTKVTPQKMLWMAGYAARKKPAEGKVQELFAKALALEDEQGNKLVFVTLDLIGVPQLMRRAVAERADPDGPGRWPRQPACARLADGRQPLRCRAGHASSAVASTRALVAQRALGAAARARAVRGLPAEGCGCVDCLRLAVRREVRHDEVRGDGHVFLLDFRFCLHVHRHRRAFELQDTVRQQLIALLFASIVNGSQNVE